MINTTQKYQIKDDYFEKSILKQEKIYKMIFIIN